MTEQSGCSLQTELDASRQKNGNSETGQRLSFGTPARRRRPGFSRKLLLGALPVTLLLAAGGLVYGQDAIDALFIDKDGNATFSGKVGIGKTGPTEKLEVTGGKIQLDGNQQIKFTDGDISNNLKLQLWSGYGLGINGSTLFYAANGLHSWRDNNGTNERMALTTGADGGLTVKGTGNSSFAGNVGIGKTLTVTGTENSSFAGKVGIATSPEAKLDVAGTVRLGKGVAESWFPYTDNNAYISGNQTIIRSDTNGNYKEFVRINQNGNVGIGTTDPGNYKLNINGNTRINGTQEVSGALYVQGPLVYYWGPDRQWKNIQNRASEYAGSYTTNGPSDLRFKKELRSIPSALDKVRKLRAVTYRWNEAALRYFTRDIETAISAGPNAKEEENQKVWQTERSKRYKELANTQVGVVAQDVEAVLPEAVSTDEAGYKSVRYHYLIPLLIAALKEQDKTVKDQAQIISRQQQEIARLAASNLIVQQQLTDLADVRAQVARLEAMLGSGDAGRSFVVPNAAIRLSTAQAR